MRKVDLDVFRAIELIRGAGGLRGLRAPAGAPPRAGRSTDDVVAAMAAAGLVGIEVDHPDQDPDDRAHAARLAADLDLIPTGSSDYHGTNKTTPIAACTTDPDAYERLLDLADRPPARRAVTGAQPSAATRALAWR